ncbi:MAG TPA: flagellar basal-body MS-ring/collar protein FliF, partial [Methylophilaceae bacterium]|nr:flagellar basal-body MS-ring/collar protein FliF [Methylophilaceae bacterium]
MNVPYHFSDGGSAILVPAEQVHEVRLKLAAQGLPKGGNIGFELLENQKFGVSQFVEQVNFQRALEGELERSIQSIDVVQTARIHLAIPKQSVFVRDQQQPSASVLLNLRAGRSLNPQQVSAIVHLVASSIPQLAPANVTIVDQNGTLLTDADKKNGANNLDPSQLKYVEELQQNIASRVEAIIAPILGAQNVHAEASAEVDFSVQEQAAEIYKPNQDAKDSAVRSMQSSESQSTSGNAASGVPGAQSNQPQPNQPQPPATASAPIEANVAAGTAAPAATPVNSQKNVTTNYEVDKTVRYTQQPMGGLKRLTVAVVVNDKHTLDKNGKPVSRPLNAAEKKQIEDLAKQAMGFNEARGDSLSIVNSSFIVPAQEVLPPIPLWKQPENIALAKDMLKLGAGLLVMFLLYRRLLKPMTRKLVQLQPDTKLLPATAEQDAVVSLSSAADTPQLPQVRGYQQNLASAKQIAKENPRMVASVVTNWVSSND